MRIVLTAIGILALACGSPAVTHSAQQGTLLAADRQHEQPAPAPEVAAAAVSTETAPLADEPAPAVAVPAVRPAATTPPTSAPPTLPPAATPPPNPQTFIRVTVAGAPALNCNPPPMTTIDCEDPRAYAMTHFALGERLPFTRILTDARGKQFYILGPWTPVGLMPVADAVPIA